MTFDHQKDLKQMNSMHLQQLRTTSTAETTLKPHHHQSLSFSLSSLHNHSKNNSPPPCNFFYSRSLSLSTKTVTSYVKHSQPFIQANSSHACMHADTCTVRLMQTQAHKTAATTDTQTRAHLNTVAIQKYKKSNG